LGFSAGAYPASTTQTTFSATVNGNLLNNNPPSPPLATNVNAVVLRCNLIDNNIVGNGVSDVLDCIPINSLYGSNINYLPQSDNFVKIKPGTYSSIVITLNDQNYNPLYALDNNVLMTFLIRLP
jgi:hypothetical protein